MPSPGDERIAIKRMLGARRIAVVGLSDDPGKASYRVAAYLQSAGKEIFPVNPTVLEVLGRRACAALDQVPGPIEVVNVFRRAEACPEVVDAAVRAGARGVWLQSGITSVGARRIAEAAGIDYVEDRCIMVELARQTRV